jgi:ferrous iron transport protein A
MTTNNEQTSLAQLPAGEQATLLAFAAGRGLLNRLASLGFTPGAEVTMTQNVGRGPLIVRVRGSQVALGRGEAEKIFIQRGCS